MKKNLKDKSLFKRNYYVIADGYGYTEKINHNEIQAIKDAGMKFTFCIPYIEGVRKFDYFELPCKIVVEEITTQKRYFDLL